MTGPTHTDRLYRWLVVSLLLHSCLLALPGGFLETLFPPKTASVETAATDLTPDFEDMAISIITMSVAPTAAALDAWEPEDAAAVLPGEIFHPAVPGTGPPEPGGHGDSDSHADTRFFPPIPRLIVPPALDDLDIFTLSVNIRILVDTDGRPVEIELPDSLVDPEIRRRLMASAGRFRFEPARKGDSPVRSWISLPLQLEASSAR
jgi:hypothetical protein